MTALRAARRGAEAALVCCLAGIAPPHARADTELPPQISQALQRAGIPAGAASFYVQEVGAYKPGAAPNAEAVQRGARPAPARIAARGAFRPLLSVHIERPMNPASTMKLVTTYAALELLGPAYTWKTIAASNAPQVGATLEGDLVLRGAGDPKLVYEGFWLMLRQLRARGIQNLRGDLLLDRSLFEPGVHEDPAAFDNEPLRPYNVGPDALLVNFKAIALRFIPDEARREVRVTIEPPLADLAIDTVPYVDGPCGDWKARLAADFSRPDRVAFGGAFPGACGDQNWNVALLDHRRYIGALFRKLWGELGGTFQGNVRDGSLPLDARILAERESPSLAEIVRDINKYSNNVMARELFLSLAAEVLKVPANPDRAQRVIRDFFANKGIAMPELVLENGSGLSRRERISALSMARLLQAAWASPVMPEFVSSLSLVGYDGTMRRRLNQNSVAGQAHIKTGTLNDARAVAGYVLAASGKRYVVVCLVNHPNAGAAQAAQDALLQWVFERG